MRLKGQVALENVFKIFILVIVILVVITLISSFRTKLLKILGMCNLLPEGCEEQGECTTIQSKENLIDQTVVEKYCNQCWAKTGEIEFRKPCLCYVVQGNFVPFSFSSENCEMKCQNQTTALTFRYDNLLRKVYIEC